MATMRKKASRKEPSECTFDELLEICQKLKIGVRCPGLEVKYTSYILERFPSKLGDGVWSIKEQRCLAFVDCHNFKAAQLHLSELQTKFGTTSKRVRQLKAMLLEAQGKYSEAQTIYDEMLDENPGNMLVRKRVIGLLKAQGKVGATIEALTGYLETFEADTAAWKELADLYLSVQRFEEALFCTAELLLASPAESQMHVRYAEILYTMGDLMTARRYYSHALELQPKNNLRALWGIVLTSKVGSGKDSTLLDSWAQKQIEKEYSANNVSAKLVVAALETGPSRSD